MAPGFPPDGETSALLFDADGHERARVRLSERVRSVAWLDRSPLVLTARGAQELAAGGQLGATYPYPAGTQVPLGPSARPYLFGRTDELVACIGNLISKDYAATPRCERTGQGAYRFEEDSYDAVACGETLVLLNHDPRELVVRARSTGLRLNRLSVQADALACVGPRRILVASRAQLTVHELPGLEVVVRLEPPKGHEFGDAVGLAHEVVYRLAGAPNALLFAALPPEPRGP